MIFENKNRTYFYNCMALFGWLSLLGFLKYFLFLAKWIEISLRVLPVLLLQVSVIATVGFAIAILLFLIEYLFSFEFPYLKFLDSKIAKKICLIGFFSECIFLLPIIITLIGVFFEKLF